MKVIKNKTFAVLLAGRETKMSYRGMIFAAADYIDPRSGGLTISEQRRRLRIMDAVEAEHDDPDEIRLEDADALTVVALLNAMRWNVISQEIVDACEEIVESCS